MQRSLWDGSHYLFQNMPTVERERRHLKTTHLQSAFSCWGDVFIYPKGAALLPFQTSLSSFSSEQTVTT